jgi:hypothetical protein
MYETSDMDKYLSRTPPWRSKQITAPLKHDPEKCAAAAFGKDRCGRKSHRGMTLQENSSRSMLFGRGRFVEMAC